MLTAPQNAVSVRICVFDSLLVLFSLQFLCFLCFVLFLCFFCGTPSAPAPPTLTCSLLSFCSGVSPSSVEHCALCMPSLVFPISPRADPHFVGFAAVTMFLFSTKFQSRLQASCARFIHKNDNITNIRCLQCIYAVKINSIQSANNFLMFVIWQKKTQLC